MSKFSFWEKFRQTCLLGKVDTAISLVKTKELAKLTKKQRFKIAKIKNKFSKNFVSANKPLESIEYIIHSYEKYWHKSLLDIKKLKKYEKDLEQSIQEWLLFNFKTKSTNKNCYDKLSNAIHQKGFKCLTGRVSHLQELEIWKKERKQIFNIKLLESKQKVNVVFMDDYITYGWMDYATCGASKVGGWAKKNALYCNSGEYKINTENFTVSYLAHEAQHFADFKRFKKIDFYALEYRAKLSEIINSKRITKKLITRFHSQSSKDRHSYHHYASYKLISNLGQTVDLRPDQIRKKAAILLQTDTQLRKNNGLKSL